MEGIWIIAAITAVLMALAIGLCRKSKPLRNAWVITILLMCGSALLLFFYTYQYGIQTYIIVTIVAVAALLVLIWLGLKKMFLLREVLRCEELLSETDSVQEICFENEEEQQD